jgi:hypothetical protein
MGKYLLLVLLSGYSLLGLGNTANAKLEDSKILTLPIRVIVFKKTGWHKYEIEPRIALANQVLSQCGIQVTADEISYLDVPSSQFDINLAGDQNKLTETGHRYPTNGKITLFYLRSSDPQQGAFSIRPSNNSAGVTDELRGSIWFTVYTKLYESYIDESSSTEAHELGHLLLDQGHVSGNEKNFLQGDPKLLSDRVNPDQCEKMRSSPYFYNKSM